MQLVGPNVATLRKMCPCQRKRFCTSTVLRLSVQALEAMRDLHSVFIIHRDIKPVSNQKHYILLQLKWLRLVKFRYGVPIE